LGLVLFLITLAIHGVAQMWSKRGFYDRP
jgi:hypothetical protein